MPLRRVDVLTAKLQWQGWGCNAQSAKRKAHGGGDFKFLIAKLGTRPKGGSPKDNLEIEEPESRIQNIENKIGFLFSHDHFLPVTFAMLRLRRTTDNRQLAN